MPNEKPKSFLDWQRDDFFKKATKEELIVAVKFNGKKFRDVKKATGIIILMFVIGMMVLTCILGYNNRQQSVLYSESIDQVSEYVCEGMNYGRLIGTIGTHDSVEGNIVLMCERGNVFVGGE